MRTFRFVLATVLAAAGLSVVVTPPAAYAAASVGTFDQCERASTTAQVCTGYTGGNLTGGYTEDQVVPQRVELEVTSAGTYTFTTTYDDLNGSKHIIDYLASYNYTVGNADPCLGYAASICAGTPSTYPIPSDPAGRGPVVPGYSNVVSAHELPQANRQWTLYGGTITGSTVTHASGATGDASVTFSTTGAGTVILMFGAHLALTGPPSTPRAWAEGASTVNGNAQLGVAGSSGGAKTHNIKVGQSTPPPPPAAFEITKSVNPTTAVPGQQVSYTVTVTNSGGLAGTTTFVDDYNDNLTGVGTPLGCTPGTGQMSCATNSLAPGASQVFTYTANVPTTFTGGAGTGGCSGGQYPVTNTATLANGTSATARVCVTAAPQFSITKTADNPTPSAGGSVVYTVKVTNNGTASGATSVTDSYVVPPTPASTLALTGQGCTVTATSFTCPTGTLAPGGSVTFSYTSVMPTAFDSGTACAGGFLITNTATLASGGSINRDVCVQAAAAFTVAKSVSDSVATPGQTVTYTVTVTNTGTATGSTTVTDDYDNRLDPSVPAGCTDDGDKLTCTTGPVLAGGQKVFTYTAAMPATFTGPSGGGGCAVGAYPVFNSATLANQASATQTVCVGAGADFTISKSVQPTAAAPGEAVTYTIVVSNTGTADGATSFVDDYDNRVTLSGLPAACTDNGDTLSCTTATIDAGTSATFTYTATMPATFGPNAPHGTCGDGSYAIGNSVTLASGPSTSADVCVEAAPQFEVTKTVDPATAEPGDTVTYTVTVSNTGTAAGATTFTDDYDDRLLPSVPSGCAISAGTLECSTMVIAAGSEQVFTYSATVPTAFTGTPGGGSCSPTSYRIANSLELENGTGASADVCVNAAPSFLIDKSISNQDPQPGEEVTYTIVVTNNGTASGSTTFTDDYDNRLTLTDIPASCTDDGDVLSCTTGTIDALDSETFEYTTTMPATFTGSGGGGRCAPGTFRIANTATLAGGADDSVVACVAATPEFEITKSVDDSTVGTGDTVTYTVTVTNTGDASGSTSFTDSYDSRLDVTAPNGCTTGTNSFTCTTSEIAAGDDEVFTYSATVPTSFTGNPDDACDPTGYELSNGVALEGEDASASASVCVAASPDLVLSKTVDQTSVSTGDQVTYTVTVTNNGTAPGSTSFTDDFDPRLMPSTATSAPAGNDCAPTVFPFGSSFTCTTGTIEAGQSQTFTYTATVPATFSSSYEIGTDGCDDDSYAILNSASIADQSTTVVVCVDAPRTAPTVTKTADTQVAAPGDEVTFTITVTNPGDSPSLPTELADDFGAMGVVSVTPSAPGDSCDVAAGSFTCQVGAIEPGQSVTFTYVATMPETFTGPSGTAPCDTGSYPVVNSAELTPGSDPASAAATVCVGASPSLVVTKTVNEENPQPGDTVTYTVTVSNEGTAPGSTTFSDDYDNRLTLSNVPAACTDDGDTLECTTDSIAAGDAAEFSYDATLPATVSGASGGGDCGPGSYLFTNLVTAVGGQTASQDVCLEASPAFAITKTADTDTVAAGGTVTYTVTVSNTGTASGTTSFVDDYDDSVTLGSVDIAPNGGSCTDDGATLACDTGTILAGESQTFTYTATMPASFTGTSGGDDCADGSFPILNAVTPGGDDASVTVCVTAAPEFAISKSAETVLAAPGQEVEYSITVTNTGTANGSTSFTDDYADGVTVTTPDGCTDAAGVLTCETEDLAPLGGSQTFTYTATVPASFGANAPQGDCGEGSYAIDNTAVLAGGDVSDGVEICVDADAQFSITKTADPADALPGATVHYTVTVTNNGTAAGSTSFTDDYDDRLSPTVPAGCADQTGSFSCATGSIDAGASETFEYDAVLPATYGTNSGAEGCDPGTFRVRNSVALEDGPGAAAVVCVTAAPEVRIDKTVDDENAGPGQSVEYTITVSNSGDAASLPVTFTDDYDDRLTPTVPAGCTDANGALTCTTEVIPAGASQVFTYTATLPASFDGGEGDGDCGPGTYPVVNSVSAGEDGPSDSVTICSPAAPAFEVAKTVDLASAQPGDTVTYTVTVTNTGDASGSTSFVDDYDALIDPTVPDGCIKLLGTLSCTTGTILAGDSESFSYTATVPTTFTGEPGGGDCGPGEYRISNGVTETSGSTAAQDVCVEASPAFAVTKSVDAPVADPGQTVHYTVTVTNTGAAAGATTFTDDYDNGLTDVTVPDGCVADTDAGTLTCTTDVILSGDSQVFEYDATLPSVYSGESGLEPCQPGEYSVVNSVTIGDETVASNTVCVDAAPEFTVTKSVDPATAEPGDTVTYTITVTNVGHVAGGTSFTDDHDDRLTPTVPDGCQAGDGVLTCTTGTIEPEASQTFTYTAVLPASYTGPSGSNGCPTGSYGVLNTVTLAGGEGSSSAPVCVTAAPAVAITKAATLDVQDNGDQVITYTITYKNTGTAEARDVVVTDPIPTGTGFVSCTGGCTTPGGTATWNVPPIAPLTGVGTVTLVVKVTSNQTCVITNTAQIKVGSAPPIASNTVSTPVTPQPDTANAKSSGSAIGLSIQTNGLLNLIGPLINALFTNNNTLTLSNASSSKTGPGAPSIGSDQVLGVKIPTNASLVKAGVISTTSMSTVTPTPAETRNTSVSEVAGVCLVPVGGICTVEADAVRAVASTMANGAYASVSTAGSTITNLKVVNTVIPVDLNTSVTIPLPAAVFGKNSYVAINEKTGTAGLKGNKYVADQSVAMIHLKITGLLLGVQAAEIYVAKATAHSEFPETFKCAGTKNQSVSGHAFLARLYASWILNNENLMVGYSQIAPLGGDESENVVDVKVPRYGVIANAMVGDTRSFGGFTGSASGSRSWAEVAGDGTKPLCVLSYVVNCVVEATVIRSEARSAAGGQGSVTTDQGTSFVGLKVLGIPIAGTPKPNTVIPLPGIGFIILNEQFCDNGSYTNGTCIGAAHSGLTVRAVRVVVTVANNLLGLTPGVELVLSEAHADTTFS